MTDRSIAIHTALAALSLVAGTSFCTSIANAAERETTAAAAAAPAAAATEQRICVRSVVIGSRVPRTVCKSRGEWIREDGGDPSLR